MANIFNTLKTYGEWSVKEERNFNSEEQRAISQAVVIQSDYGLSVCFTMKAGGAKYIPVSSQSKLGLGEVVDMKSAKLLTLEKAGEDDIFRVE